LIRQLHSHFPDQFGIPIHKIAFWGLMGTVV
jgi:hypothetical protein